jgi:hypothetical protein
MERFIENCYKNPNHPIRDLLKPKYSVRVNELFNKIRQYLDKINEVYGQTKMRGKMVEAKKELISIIPNYYSEIIELLHNFDKNKNLTKEEIVAVNAFIQLYGQCSFDVMFKTEKSYISPSSSSPEQKIFTATTGREVGQAAQKLMTFKDDQYDPTPLKKGRTEGKFGVFNSSYQGTEESKGEDTMDEEGEDFELQDIYREEDRIAQLILHNFNVEDEGTAKEIIKNILFEFMLRKNPNRINMWMTGNDDMKINLLNDFIQKYYSEYGLRKKKNFGGKLKTSKISKKYKNKLTRRKLKYKNKKTYKKNKNLKHRYSRRNK